MQKSIRKWKFDTRKIVTPENFNSKLCTRDYVGETKIHANFGFNQLSGASPQAGEIYHLCDFLDCPEYPSLLFFSSARPDRTTGRIFTRYGSNDVFPHKEVLFRG